MFDIGYWVKNKTEEQNIYSRIFNTKDKRLPTGNAATIYENKSNKRCVCVVTIDSNFNYSQIIKSTKAFDNVQLAITYADINLSETFTLDKPLNFSVLIE